MAIRTIGIDLGETVCDAVAMDARGKLVAGRRLPRGTLIAWLANLPACRIGMAASCGAHHRARRLVRQGRRALAKALPEVLETDALSPLLHGLLERPRQPWQALDAEIAALDRPVLAIARADARSCRLMTIPGIGPLIATALVAAIAIRLSSGRQSRARGPSLRPGRRRRGRRARPLPRCVRPDPLRRATGARSARTAAPKAPKAAEPSSPRSTRVRAQRPCVRALRAAPRVQAAGSITGGHGMSSVHGSTTSR